MTDDTRIDDDARIDELLADYFRRVDAGEKMDWEAFARQHSAEAPLLREILEGEQLVHYMAGPRLDEQPPGDGDPGFDSDPGSSDPGSSDPGNNDPGNNDPGNNDPGNNDPGNNDPGNNDPGNNGPGDGDLSDGDLRDGDPGNGDLRDGVEGSRLDRQGGDGATPASDVRGGASESTDCIDAAAAPVSNGMDETLPPGGIDSTQRAPSPHMPPAFHPGQLFAGYQLIEELGRGGMGVVYRARQLGLRRWVALKMILNGRLASADDRRRFYSEARSTASIQHPNIVRIIEVDEHHGQPFFSMELIEGQDLSELGRDAQLPARRAAELLAVAADAVQAAHDHRVLHRDLKPANILVDGKGRVVVTDFGLAKSLEDGATAMTASGQAVGTPAYMSPEQARGRSREVGTASDVYSLGAVLFFLLTGAPPFEGNTPMSVLMNVIARPAPHPRTIQPQADETLCLICLKCLEKDPLRRYESASELAADLRNFLNGRPLLARRSHPFRRAWSWSQQIPIVAGALGRPSVHPTPAHLRAQAALMLALLVSAVLAVSFPAVRRAAAQRLPPRIVVATGVKGGAYDGLTRQLSARLAETPGCQECVTLPTSGAEENRRRLLSGEAHLALLQENMLRDDQLAVIAPAFYETVHVVVRRRLGITQWRDLSQRRLAVGPPGSGMALTAEEVLQSVDARQLPIDFRSLANEADADAIDGAVVTIGPDSASLRELLANDAFQLLELPAEELERLTHIPTFRLQRIRGADNQSYASVGTPALLVCRRDAPDRLVEACLSHLYRLPSPIVSIPQADVRHWRFLPLHPAARRWFENPPPTAVP